jgi:hypothetical protein
MDIHLHVHFSPAIESLATVLSDQLQKELEKGITSAAEAPPAAKPKRTPPAPAPMEAPTAAEVVASVQQTAAVAAVVPAPAPTGGAVHTRESIKAAIQAAKLAKAKIAELLAGVGAESLTKMPDDKLQQFGDAVQSAIGAPDAAPVPAAAAAPEALKGFTRESIMPLYVDAMAKDRPGLIKLLSEFNAIKLSTLDDSKIPAFGAALQKFLTPVAA